MGSVIRAKTIPPTIGAERGRCITLRKIAKPSRPKIIDGTAARLLILISIISVNLFFGASSSKNTPAATAIGNERINAVSYTHLTLPTSG